MSHAHEKCFAGLHMIAMCYVNTDTHTLVQSTKKRGRSDTTGNATERQEKSKYILHLDTYRAIFNFAN